MSSSSSRARRLLPLAGLALCLSAFLPAQESPPIEQGFGEKVEVIAVTVAVRAREGKEPAARLGPADLTVREDGVDVPVLAVERAASAVPVGAPAAAAAPGQPAAPPAARPWRVVVYFDLQMAGVTSVRQAAWELGGQAESLAALGEVEIVLADDRPERVFEPSRDPEAIKKALRKRVSDNFGQRRVVRLRQEFTQQSGQRLGLANRRGSDGGASAELNLVRVFGFEETRFLENRRQMLEAYFAERSAPDWPQAAFLVTGGYDLDPGEFYLPLAEGDTANSADAQRVRADFQRLHQGRPNEGVARQLAALGWTVYPVLPYDQDTSVTGTAQEGGAEAWSAMFGAARGRTGPMTLIRHPQEPWEAIAETTGGELVADVRKLDEAIDDLEARWLVTYQIGRRRDGALHRLEIAPRRPGLEIRGPEWVAGGTPEALAASRAKALLAGEKEAGDLPVSASVTPEPASQPGQVGGRIEAKVEFAPLGESRAALRATTLRFTIAVPRPDGTAMVIHELAERADLSARAGWIFQARLLAPEKTSRIAVVVEELTTGAWGAALASWPARTQPSGG